MGRRKKAGARRPKGAKRSKVRSKPKGAQKAAPKKKARVPKKPVPVEPGERVGEFTHYFPHVNAGVVELKKGTLRLGDKIAIKGHTTSFEQQVTSMQIDHKPIERAEKGDEIGLGVKSRVRAGDILYRID